MSSSTSSSRFDKRALALILALLLVVEICFRIAEPWLSLDIKHIRQIPEIVAALDSDDHLPSVLFLGNSLTRRGVDVEGIVDALSIVGVAPVSVAAVYPDDTTILDWLYLHEHEVVQPNVVPDYLILGFALRHLVDSKPRPTQTYRLGRHFTSWRSLRELFREDVLALGDRANVVLSRMSFAFANRERVSRRVLAALPWYELTANRVHEAMRDDDAASGRSARPTYRTLERFLIRGVESGSTVIVVAMPVRSAYTLDPVVERVIEANGAVLVDARRIPGLEGSHFLDGLHLSERGAELYSAYLGQILASHMAHPSEGDSQ